MDCTELALRIIELIIAALIPALIAYFGFRLMRKAEDIKNESASKYLWSNKWIDILFQKHVAYSENVIEFIAIWTRLLHLLEQQTTDSQESQELQAQNNVCTAKLLRTSTDYNLLSINAFGQNNEIKKLLDEIWGCVSYIVNNKRIDKQANPKLIFQKLCTLNQVTERLIQKKFISN